MYRIAIVDDNKDFLEELNQVVSSYYENQQMPVNIKCYDKSERLLYDLDEKNKYDVYLLDIEMPVVNGLKLASKIRIYDSHAFILFITSHIKYSIVGYELNVFRYIPKALIADKLTKALDDLTRNLINAESNSYLIANSSRYEKVAYKEIYYIYKEGKNSIFVCKEKESRVRKSLKDVFDEMQKEEFLFIERGYIVNMDHILKIESNDVYIRDGEILRIGRSYIQEVKQKIFEYWGHTKWNL